MTLKINKKI